MPTKAKYLHCTGFCSFTDKMDAVLSVFCKSLGCKPQLKENSKFLSFNTCMLNTDLKWCLLSECPLYFVSSKMKLEVNINKGD